MISNHDNNGMLKTCYCCDSPATSREHVPPLCLFPETKDLEEGINLRRNLITVPACDTHNLQKSMDDEYLLLLLVHGYFNNTTGSSHFSSKVIRALKRKPTLAHLFYQGHTPVAVDGKETIAVDIDLNRFEKAIKSICQGLYYYKYKKPWTNDITVLTPLLIHMDHPNAEHSNQKLSQMSKRMIELAGSQPKLGDNPEVFWYQLLDQYPPSFAWRLVFYGGFEIFGLSSSSEFLGCNI